MVAVRRFFSRLTARDAAPLTAGSWATAPVERFFLTISQPAAGLLSGRPRGPAIAPPKALDDAFADFVWE